MTDLSSSFPWLSDVRKTMSERDRRLSESTACAIHVCLGRHCQRRGGRQLIVAFEDALADAGVEGCPVVKVGCRDRCDDAPSVDIYPGPARYNHLTPTDAARLVAAMIGEEAEVPGETVTSQPPWERDRVLSRRERRRLDGRPARSEWSAAD